MSTIKEFESWLVEILRRQDKFSFRKFIDGSGKTDSKTGETTCRVRIYTEDHAYSIVAVEKKKGKSYLGCTAVNRKPRAGENWNRGNDLADGPLSRRTWERIKDDIISYELVLLDVQTEFVEEDKKVPEDPVKTMKRKVKELQKSLNYPPKPGEAYPGFAGDPPLN